MNTSVLDDQVVHEAIDERQHIRTRIPASAVLTAGSRPPISCQVADVSLGGVGLLCEKGVEVGDVYQIEIKLNLNRIDLSFKAKVKVLSLKDGLAGTQFVDLDPQKADVLRYIISAYLSGDIADINGLVNVMQRENYIKERKKKAVLQRTAWERVKAGLGTLFFISLGLLALAYVVYQAYLLFFRIPAAQAMVSTDAYVISMPENGNVRFLIPETQTQVSAGEPVASVSTQLGTSLTSAEDLAALMNLAPDDVGALLNRASFETVISSPCDCVVHYQRNQRNGFGYKGDALVHLLPQNEPMVIRASVPYEKMDRLRRTQRVSVQVYGADAAVDGRIVGASLNEQTEMVVLEIEPEQALSISDYNQPAWVNFYLGLPGMSGPGSVAALP